jgi:hypothetical protein
MKVSCPPFSDSRNVCWAQAGHQRFQARPSLADDVRGEARKHRFPSHKAEGRANWATYARWIASKVRRFQRSKLSRPQSVLTPLDRPHNALTRRHGEGARTATDAAFGGGRAGSVCRWSSVTPRASRSGSLKHRDEALAARDRRMQQAWAEIAHAVQDAPTSCPSGASIGAG